MRAYLAILLVAPGALAAQEYTLAPYAAQNRSLPGTPALFGASLARYRSVIGLRVGGAAGPTLTPLALGTDGRATAWTADADVVLDAGRFPVIGALLAGFVPTVFAGAGAQGLAAASGDVWAPVTSYGVLVSRPIFAGFAVETEARHRTPARLESRSLPEGFQRGWEYRVGFSLRFGGRRGAGTPSRWPSSSRVPAPVPTSPTGGRPGAPASASAARVLSTADRYLGVKYVYGGSSPSGFDCSGFVQYVFRQHGVTLPRTSRQQATVGARAAAQVSALRPGDLMLFASRGSRIDHVAIYAGDHRIIHSTSSGGGVRYDDLRSDRGRWFVARHVAPRRVLDDGRSLVRALDAAALAPAPLDPPDPAPKPRR
jgi:cell wall-associated NlpC family hydrolase